MFRASRHLCVAAAVATTAAAGVLGGCAPKDYGADFPENFAKLDKQLGRVQDKVDRRMPALGSEIHTPSLKLRRELRSYQGELRQLAGELGKLNKATDVEDEANALTGYMRDEEDEFHAMRNANRGHHRRWAYAAIRQLEESSRGVDRMRPKVAALARKQARS